MKASVDLCGEDHPFLDDATAFTTIGDSNSPHGFSQRLQTVMNLTAAAGLHTPPSDLDGVGDVAIKDGNGLSVKGKEKVWIVVPERKRPLQLLDLPIDILREIISQLPHTNDLTSLALCHSVFHSLCISCIYSRFDIVWPDVNVDTSSRAGVDALTYGLSTLVMAEEVFREAPWQRRMRQEHLAMMGEPDHVDPYPIPKRRRGNNYAQYTKKFSLGNGPPEWVQEYLITKEGGKMLGTLVALAIARMQNLESFIWDMPTGVLRDIWLALSSLAERDDGQDSRLEKLWIRWHNNLEGDLPHGGDPPPPPPQIANALPPPPPPHPAIPGNLAVVANTIGQTLSLSPPLVNPVEHPTFSVLPPLKSINVLDIDELAYLDELSVLIARSQKRLRELRIGIAQHAHQRNMDWVNEWEGDEVHQVDYSTPWTIGSKIGERRLGGVLGVLLGRVYNLRNNARIQRRNNGFSMTQETPGAEAASAKPADHTSTTPGPSQVSGTSVNHQTGAPVLGLLSAPLVAALEEVQRQESPQSHSISRPIPLRPAKSLPVDARKNGPFLTNRLELETLELERVPLSIAVLTQAFDWSKLTSLTLLNCHDHEQLWRILRRAYSPVAPKGKDASLPPSSKHFSQAKRRCHYHLNLKKIHTDTVSVPLISFLKETLAPNSLEVLFLQEGGNSTSNVSIDAIYKGAIRRHRASLKRLMIDSSGGDGNFVDSTTRWKRWMLSREIVAYITSGRMPSLRELGMTLDYRDWHFFLQNLPQTPHLRSLYIPHIADHPHGSNIDSKDLVMQMVDIVALRPEIELCYIGLGSKCFEILENRQHGAGALGAGNRSGAGAQGDALLGTAGQVSHHGYVPLGSGAGHAAGVAGAVDDDDEDDDDADGQEGDEDEDDDGVAAPVGMAAAAAAVDDDSDDDLDDTASELSSAELDAVHLGLDDGSDDDDESFLRGKVGAPRLSLREILFYDDKVAVFKARHGRL